MTESQTAMSRLRTETRDCHTATERTPLACAMARGTLTLEQYVAQLEAYASIHRALEEAIARSEDARVHAVFTHEMRKVPLLESDLAALDRVARLPLRSPTGAVQRYIEDVARDAADGAALLGHVYVFEGSTIGASILLPAMISALRLSPEQSSFYRGYGHLTFAHWEAFKARANAVFDDEPSQTRAVAAARRTFDAIRVIFEQIAEASTSRSSHRPSLGAPAPQDRHVG